VRVEAIRLRSKLREYYEDEGKPDAIHFVLPKGSYVIHVIPRPCATLGAGNPSQVLQTAAITSGEANYTGDPGLGLHPVEDRPSLAVLPFSNISSDPEQEYFADGITEGLITELSRIPELFVISRHSSFVYKGVSKRAEEIGKELGVKNLLEGSVQRSGERVRITIQLVDAISRADLWAERYDRSLEDIFAVQDDVIQRVVAILQVKLAGRENVPHGSERSINIEAHDCLLRGLEHFWIFTRDSIEEAREQFARAGKARSWLCGGLRLARQVACIPVDSMLEYQSGGSGTCAQPCPHGDRSG
jgi:Predicted integral membrane protein